MSEDIFDADDFKSFRIELRSKLKAGVHEPINILYMAMTLIGVGWASWAIPSLNRSEISPETFGIYVIGFLISVGLDALVVWKNTSDDNRSEEAISVLIMIFSIIFIIASSWLSLKDFQLDNPNEPGIWKCSAYFFLPLILISSIFMSLVLTGFDSKPITLPSIQTPTNKITDKG